LGYESGLSIAMSKLTNIPELWKHSHLTALVCKNLISFLPQNYLSVSPENLCMAALFHDLGKVDWPQHWFYIPKQKLAKNELQMMNNHPQLGAKMLENLVPGIPKETIALIANHHERPGGKGYPQHLNNVSRDVLVLAACDVYCACTETREYRKRVLMPEEALEIVTSFAPREIVQGLWALQKEGCHERFRVSVTQKAKTMGTGIRF
jgi:putative nucleotidyltransferase with HDIG domain